MLQTDDVDEMTTNNIEWLTISKTTCITESTAHNNCASCERNVCILEPTLQLNNNVFKTGNMDTDGLYHLLKYLRNVQSGKLSIQFVRQREMQTYQVDVVNVK